MKSLVVVSGSEQTDQDRRLIRLAAWMGIPVRPILIRDGESIGPHLLDELKPYSCALAMSARTLVMLKRELCASKDVRPFLAGVCAELLVFVGPGSAEEAAAISELTQGAISGARRIEQSEITISFPEGARDCSRQLAGLAFVRRGGEPVSVFALRQDASDCTVIAAANGCPMFVRVTTVALQVFLLGGPSLPDLDESLSREHEVRDHYDRLLPALMALRQCFGESCWHNPRPTARLIIDDPLLTPRYGFLDYHALLESMKVLNYGTSIAFIPWNGWRTSKRDVKRLLGSAHLSLCIHGCDHANREFEGRDPALLGRKSALALQRMESLREGTGAEFDPVMVFPQERYSAAAIDALRRQPYLAIVNTLCAPTDSEPGELKIRDFLSPAITRYHGFPIFQRRYPRRLFDLACDLFLGKPALMVEHHDYFRNGISPLEDLVTALNRIEPGLRWPGLSSQLEESCLSKNVAHGPTEVRFFTRQFRLMPQADGGPGRFLLSKHEPDSSRIGAVLVDGRAAEFGFEGEFLNLEVQAQPGEVREIEIVDLGRKSDKAVDSFGIRHNAGVLVRRRLSEFRDNALSRHHGIGSVAQWMADKLNVTGAGYDDAERYGTHE